MNFIERNNRGWVCVCRCRLAIGISAYGCDYKLKLSLKHGSAINPGNKIGDLQFYKFSFLELSIALLPQLAIIDLEYLLQLAVTDEISSAIALQKLIDTGRKAGLQIFISVEHPESALPEVHGLTLAIFPLEKWNEIYLTPTGGGYQKNKLLQLFGL